MFNVNGGYLEGIVRGYRNALLTGTNYSNVGVSIMSRFAALD
jgi:V-type H+-transporting ATPase subunit d